MSDGLIKFAEENSIELRRDEPMSAHTSFRIGGPARLYACVRAELAPHLRELARAAGLKTLVTGNGSNLLVADAGYDGLVLRLADEPPQLREDGVIYAPAGTGLARLAAFAAEHELSGLEFAAGIPGSVGGAVMMNAGAYGGQMSDVLTLTRYWDGEAREMRTEDGGFGYRRSPFFGTDALVLGAEIRLRRGERGEIEAKMAELAAQRREKQPLNLPSAGSAFKRPQGHFAGKLIEDCGLKGYAVGGAQVSEKHAGFVINRGGATCADVLRLLEHIEKTVYDRFGVRLEREIQVIE